MSERCVDIIIPVYNGYDDVKKCIDSVKKHTDLSRHRVLFIDDKSTDERMLPLLRAAEDEGILVLCNEENLGFSGTINRGIHMSKDRDVILLNSDTVVTARWVDKLIACAYSDTRIGTVTPMSNSATLCSYPVFCADNDILPWHTIDSEADAVERASRKRYPRIPVAVGFCLYIKRETLEKVGDFDVETFGRGYGEENDFCFRAEQEGYIHVMCDDTFIYHKGTVSFDSEEKRKLIEAHAKILEERYPAQVQAVTEYTNKRPHQEIHDEIDLYAATDPTRKNLMYFLHADFREDAFDHTAGTQLHVRDLTMALKDRFNVYVVARDDDFLRVTLYSDDRVASLRYPIGMKESDPMARDEKLAGLLRELITAFRIDLVHIHHMLGLGMTIADVAREQKVPTVLSMHDYYFINPYTLRPEISEEEQEKCEKWHEACREFFAYVKQVIVPSKSVKTGVTKVYPEISDKVSVIGHGIDLPAELPVYEIPKEKVRVTSDAVTRRRKIFDDIKNPSALTGFGFVNGKRIQDTKVYVELTKGKARRVYKADEVVDPAILTEMGTSNIYYARSGFSLAAVDEFWYGKTAEIRIYLACEGVLYTDGIVYRRKILRPDEYTKIKPLYHVAVLGGVIPSKGSDRLKGMIETAGEKIVWHIFGMSGDPAFDGLDYPNIIRHGVYRREEVPTLLAQNRIDLTCILSRAPETFCYTLSESLASGVPVFATNVGALEERLAESKCGVIADANLSDAEMAEKLLTTLSNEQEMQRLREAVATHKEKTVAVMVEEYTNIYRETAKEPVEPTTPDGCNNSFDRFLIASGLAPATDGILRTEEITFDAAYESKRNRRFHQVARLLKQKQNRDENRDA